MAKTTKKTASKKPAAKKTTTKKTTATKATTTKKATSRGVTKSRTAVLPTHEQVQQRAFEIFLRRNGAPGDPQADWYQAEQELTAELTASTK
jgi:hypothetical protein